MGGGVKEYYGLYRALGCSNIELGFLDCDVLIININNIFIISIINVVI